MPREGEISPGKVKKRPGNGKKRSGRSKYPPGTLPNAELHIIFNKLNIKHEFRILDGGHDGGCVNRSMDEALEFIKTNITESNFFSR